MNANKSNLTVSVCGNDPQVQFEIHPVNQALISNHGNGTVTFRSEPLDAAQYSLEWYVLYTNASTLWSFCGSRPLTSNGSLIHNCHNDKWYELDTKDDKYNLKIIAIDLQVAADYWVQASQGSKKVSMYAQLTVLSGKCTESSFSCSLAICCMNCPTIHFDLTGIHIGILYVFSHW